MTTTADRSRFPTAHAACTMLPAPDRLGAHRMVIALDAGDPAPARVLPRATSLLTAGDQLVIAVLHPPRRLSLNARLAAWQHTQRAHATTTVLAPLIDWIRRAGLPERGVLVHTTSWAYRRGLGPRHQRIATALVRLCRTQHADQLVLLHSPHAGLLTDTAHRRLAEIAPPWLRIYHIASAAAPLPADARTAHPA